MNSKIFEQWIEKQLVPALPKKSLIVMDNALYHSVRVEGTKPPTSNSRKGDMVDFLNKLGVEFDMKKTKPKLYEIIKSKKNDPVYKVDEFLKRKGHEVLRLPPYHCEFSPIELIWGNLKGFIGQENSTFKLNDVKSLIQKGFEQINSTTWLNSCNHIKTTLNQDIGKRMLYKMKFKKNIIHIESDYEIESESENDNSSDGDETEDYEWP
ncbi:unnamed protein product [Mytilus coruscus]|uniref:Tc1-like transposase DDE domain-containing protein n=1 Tax=Mytilus coruscus TaxID=42192 RepID=A0A6J8CLA7_MYTCO|nr:unnamed protein product [Mytilus coruscus]